MAMWKLANWPKNVLMGYAAKKISSISTVTLAMFSAVRQILTPETVADSYPVDSVADSYPGDCRRFLPRRLCRRFLPRTLCRRFLSRRLCRRFLPRRLCRRFLPRTLCRRFLSRGLCRRTQPVSPKCLIHVLKAWSVDIGLLRVYLEVLNK